MNSWMNEPFSEFANADYCSKEELFEFAAGVSWSNWAYRTINGTWLAENWCN